MKNIKNYDAEKYELMEYTKIEEGIYKIGNEFVTSLSFEQEHELGEGMSPQEISQYPLEDILDEFCVYVSDFYNELNNNSNVTCYYEFGSEDIINIKKLHNIIGKHVYNKTEIENDDEFEVLIID